MAWVSDFMPIYRRIGIKVLLVDMRASLLNCQRKTTPYAERELSSIQFSGIDALQCNLWVQRDLRVSLLAENAYHIALY